MIEFKVKSKLQDFVKRIDELVHLLNIGNTVLAAFEVGVLLEKLKTCIDFIDAQEKINEEKNEIM